MISLLDTLGKMAVGAALVLFFVQWERGVELRDEILLMNLVWPITLFAKLTLEKRLKVVANG